MEKIKLNLEDLAIDPLETFAADDPTQGLVVGNSYGGGAWSLTVFCRPITVTLGCPSMPAVCPPSGAPNPDCMA